MVLEEKEIYLYEKFRHSSPFEVLHTVTGGKVRGLDLLALRRVLAKNQKHPEIINVLLIYFYKTFAGKPFDRNALLKVFDFWQKNNVHTFKQAVAMTERDIRTILKDGMA
ncbi:hypothetical protein DRW41_04720 [Neobacillus piezotolerans]|uniref:DnaD domain-containing protein n=1 Tax=Neobacillus piezotolerans TaxID=2259171 RepID=A0A3D8GWP2_9BACI|nr:hypothetical protein [Neobacillus piezotolerans]RDU38864.1 hypothetical protein DRW41_04720 [Neobacillus piezotolerans]